MLCGGGLHTTEINQAISEPGIAFNTSQLIKRQKLLILQQLDQKFHLLVHLYRIFR